MKLIGIVTGVKEGHNWARLILTEPTNNTKCIGENAIISKVSYNYVMSEVFPQFDLFKDQEVSVSYDRFGKVQEVRLV